MNEYYEEASKPVGPTFTETSALEFIQVAAVPKTPLQRAVGHFHSSSQRATNASSPQLEIHETSASHDNLGTLVQTQKEIADLVIMQQNLSLLPKREVPVYDGNPLSYQYFMHAFKYLIEDKTNSCQDRLYFLEQFTSGQAKDLVRSCLHMDARRGYSEAMQLLKKHFGNEMKIANAYLDKALNWTVIKADDGKSLHAYALYLKECCNAMQDLEYMDELDVTSNLKLIVSKLPYKLRERWRTRAYEAFQKTNTRARFKHLVDFIEAQSNILLHPMFGDIREPIPTKKLISNFRTPKRGSSFVTTVKAAEEHNTKPQVVKEHFCQGKHALVDCLRLKSEPQEKKVESLKRSGYCFGCLKKGHMSKDCKRRLDCQICQRKHPTLLHIDGRSLKQEAPQNLIPTEPKETSINSALVSADKVTGAGKECALAIVPVQVKVAKGNKSLLTYAFLDPGSSATFCTENLMKQLNAKGRRTEILLRTMGQERPVKSYELTGLEVSNLDGSEYIDLPKIFTQAKIPVSKENLLTQADLEKWPHLSGIQLKEINADIEILIGMDVPKAMEPWQVINSQGNGPYAVKTILGWVVNGPLNPAMEESGTSVSVNRISMENLRDLLVRQYNQDFPEKEYEEKREMSCEDRKFMETATSSIIFKNGHYHLPLPFRDKNVVLPNNYEVAAQRILNLAKKFNRDTAYAAEYKIFMDDVLGKGYAQKVPQERLQRNDGHVWYIPHHGVYHKQKKKLRVVFDCSSACRGKSLNGEQIWPTHF
ncbi:hypothetical protein N1851_003872 [Merluccius polli]|uniref:CCHC-type domain-containing protein n=1 Tax=Merluccius polli TaxID=89951 RepID=A0AA47N9B6_MERPO|nr:hypothetical protein N1851_003872 [Merluccius polli]